MTKYQQRTYRNDVQKSGLSAFRVVVKETDLHIQADRSLEAVAKKSILQHRGVLENYIDMYPEFATTMTPWFEDGPRPLLVDEMIRAGRKAGVGPMAAVAGAIAASVGGDLMVHSSEVIVENGGDVFIKTRDPLIVGLYAGASTLSMKIGLRSGGGDLPLAICTSSGTVGHSVSFGRADAVCVVSESCALADAVATAVGNRVNSAGDIQSGIDWGRQIRGVQGIIIIAEGKMGAWGGLELVSLSREKG